MNKRYCRICYNRQYSPEPKTPIWWTIIMYCVIVALIVSAMRSCQ